MLGVPVNNKLKRNVKYDRSWGELLIIAYGCKYALIIAQLSLTLILCNLGKMPPRKKSSRKKGLLCILIPCQKLNKERMFILNPCP